MSATGPKRKRKQLDWSSTTRESDAELSDQEEWEQLPPINTTPLQPKATRTKSGSNQTPNTVTTSHNNNPTTPSTPTASPTGNTRHRSQRQKFPSSAVIEDGDTPQPAKKKRGRKPAVASDSDDDYGGTTTTPTPSISKSARLQSLKRKSYREAEEDDFQDKPGEDEIEPVSEKKEASTRRPTTQKKKSTADPSSPTFLDLNACLGRSQIERILARKKLPAPKELFLSTFLKHLSPDSLARVHPQDLENFHPAAYAAYELKRKEAEAEAMKKEEQRRLKEWEDKKREMEQMQIDSGGGYMDGNMNSYPQSNGFSLTSEATSSYSLTAPPPPPSSISFSLTASPDVSLPQAPEQPKPTHASVDKEEYYYLIKWQNRSYSSISLHWIPHSLLMLFNDGPVRIRRYERTREYGETRGTTRISKSDEELEDDEENIMEIAHGLRQCTLDERMLQQQVEEKEAESRRKQDALAPIKSSTLSSLLSTVLPAITSSNTASVSAGSTTSAADNSSSNTTTSSTSDTVATSSSSSTSLAIDASASVSATSSTSADSTTSTAAPSTSTTATLPTDGVHLTPAQLLELEQQLETNRIARRLADISNDHKLARFKKIKTGYFDPDYAIVERIIGHQRRVHHRHAKATRLYFSPNTPKDHWTYYGLNNLKEVKQIEKQFAKYVQSIDLDTKKYLLNMAEALDPRIRLQREEQERADSIAVKSESTIKVKSDEPVKAESKVSEDVEMTLANTDHADNAEKKGHEQDDIEMKSSIKPEVKSESSTLDPESSVKMETDGEEKDQTASSKRPTRGARANSRRGATTSNPTPPASTTTASGRPRRNATKRVKVDDDSIDFLKSEDDEDYQAILQASKIEALGDGAEAESIEDDDRKPMLDDDDDDESASSDSDPDTTEADEFEFLVKWQKLPYDACTWETRSTLKRMDQLRKQSSQLASSSTVVTGGFSELNSAVPVPPLASIPFIPLSTIAFSNNLLLKCLDLPIIVDDVTHLSNVVTENASKQREETARETGQIGLAASQQPYRAAIHPTVPLSSVLGPQTNKASTSSANAQPPQAVTRTCVEALHHYLLIHSSQTLDSSIVYPTNSKSANAQPIDDKTPASFSMSSAAVTTDMHFGPNQNMSLRPYQVDGINWLALNWSTGRNSILADEMGLGKTVSSTMLMNYVITRQHFANPILVVAPLSTIGFWLREVERFSNLYGIIYRGTPESRKMIRGWDWKWCSKEEMDELDGLRKEEGIDVKSIHSALKVNPNATSTKGTTRRQYKFNVMITSYEFIINDFSVLSRIPFSALVIDEAQRLKNSSSKLFERLSTFKIPRKLLLTGTPIQNDMGELWSLLHFIEPNSFPSLQAFLDEFQEMNTLEQVTKLYHSLRPFVLRRLKSDVEKSLPPKEEILIEIDLTRIQKKYYRAVYEKNYKFLAKKDGAGGQRQINGLINVSMQLRKVSQHPYLIDGCEQDELGLLQQQQMASGKGMRALTQDAVMEKLVSCSGKFILLDKLLPKLKHEGHRVLIFSQMTRLLDILQDYLHYRRYKHERLDGNVGTAERQMSIDKFSEPNSDIFAFLLSTRAGGLGITLTAADTVIIFDSDWNLQNDLQAVDRTHRIGQTKSVKVYRLLTKGTYEMEMFHRACLKLTLDHVVMASMSQEVSTESNKTATALQSRGSNTSRQEVRDIKANLKKKAGGNEDGEDAPSSTATTLSSAIPFDKAEVESMLKNGAYNIFGTGKKEEENELHSIQFAEEDISIILNRSQVVKYATDKEGEAVAVETDVSNSTTAAAPKTSTFSKASFVPRDGGEELSLSDPQFWSKIGLVDRGETDAAADSGVLDGKRVRRPVQAFNATTEEEPMHTRVDVLGKKTKSGPARCQVCQMVTRDDETVPILICDICEDEAHLTCLGLYSIPVEDQWACPSCVRHAKKTTRKRSAQDEDDDADWGPDPSLKKHLTGLMPVGASGAVSASSLPVKVNSSIGLKRVGSSSNSMANDPRTQYERLLTTYRHTHPGKTEEDYQGMTNRMWKNIFKSDPPPPRPVVTPNPTTPNNAPTNSTTSSNPTNKDPSRPGLPRSSSQKKEHKYKSSQGPRPPHQSSRPQTTSNHNHSAPKPQAAEQQPAPETPTGPVHPLALGAYNNWPNQTPTYDPSHPYYQQQQPQPQYHQYVDQYGQPQVDYSQYQQPAQYPYAPQASYYPQYQNPYGQQHLGYPSYAPTTYTSHYGPDGTIQYTQQQQPHPLHQNGMYGQPQTSYPPHPSPITSIDPNKCGSASCSKLDGADGVQFLVCGKCLKAKYCSKECQLVAWKGGHKQECVAPTQS